MSRYIGKPPAGADLDANQAPRNNGVLTTLVILATISIVIRLVARFKEPQRKLFLDDWFIIVAWQPLLALLIIGWVGSPIGLGKHAWCTSVAHYMELSRYLFTSIIVYIFVLALVKHSILLFYRRVFGPSWLYYIATAFTKTPRGGHWRFDFYKYYVGNAAGNIVTDFVVLLVPAWTIWNLKMRLLQKIMVSAVLLLGAFVFIASCVRLHYLTFLKGEGVLDLPWTMGPICLWSVIEPCIGMITACFPTMQGVVQSALKLEQNHFIQKHAPIVRSRSDMLDKALGKQGIDLHFQSEPDRHSGGHKITPSSTISDRSQQEDDYIRLFTNAAYVEASEPTRQRGQGLRPIEEFLGPSFIRVQHDVDVSYDRRY
ncbi:hypothetical protein N7468_004995 [Penicillium chermesinum]|uniref:Rhodopsin domain-containing protein n=1 Tax=Penicillium chermesinum TaxID=63820 RepID=A0A9W9NYC1_9EURO|nr:uncharacterized protein N7468_004995 [Penicillium chermesinum]KAJ5232039.1 hypothetical protein N7468_004995 [Penicillium chermesinum]